jgi:hypothetical protein
MMQSVSPSGEAQAVRLQTKFMRRIRMKKFVLLLVASFVACIPAHAAIDHREKSAGNFVISISDCSQSNNEASCRFSFRNKKDVEESISIHPVYFVIVDRGGQSTVSRSFDMDGKEFADSRYDISAQPDILYSGRVKFVGIKMRSWQALIWKVNGKNIVFRDVK